MTRRATVYHQRPRAGRRVSASSPKAAAAREGIHGWVRNLPDGRVEAAAEGEAEAIDRFEGKLRHGPPGARVEHVEVEDTVPVTATPVHGEVLTFDHRYRSMR